MVLVIHEKPNGSVDADGAGDDGVPLPPEALESPDELSPASAAAMALKTHSRHKAAHRRTSGDDDVASSRTQESGTLSGRMQGPTAAAAAAAACMADAPPASDVASESGGGGPNSGKESSGKATVASTYAARAVWTGREVASEEARKAAKYACPFSLMRSDRQVPSTANTLSQMKTSGARGSKADDCSSRNT